MVHTHRVRLQADLIQLVHISGKLQVQLQRGAARQVPTAARETTVPALRLPCQVQPPPKLPRLRALRCPAAPADNSEGPFMADRNASGVEPDRLRPDRIRLWLPKTPELRIGQEALIRATSGTGSITKTMRVDIHQAWRG